MPMRSEEIIKFRNLLFAGVFFAFIFAPNVVLGQSVHKLRNLQIVGLTRTSEQWFKSYLGLFEHTPVSDEKLDNIRLKLQNLLIFSSAQVNPTYLENDLVDLEIVLDEKWTTIPVIRGSYGGGTPMTVLGLYDTNSFGRMYTLGIETHKYGTAAPGLVSWFKAPYLFQGRVGFSFITAKHYRIRQLYNGRNLDKTNRFLHSSWATLDVEWMFSQNFTSFYSDESDKDHSTKFGLRILNRKDFSNKITDRDEAQQNDLDDLVMDEPLIHDSVRNYFATQVVYRNDSLAESMNRFVGSKFELKLGFERDGDERDHAFHEVEGFYFPEKLVFDSSSIALHGFAGMNYSPSLNSRYYLGGFDSVRGYPDGFVLGKVATYANFELRKTISYSPTLAYDVVGFFDMGSAFDPDVDYDSGLLSSVGAGFRISFPKIYRMMFRLDFGKTLTKTKPGDSAQVSIIFFNLESLFEIMSLEKPSYFLYEQALQLQDLTENSKALDAFLEYVDREGLQLYEAQEEAIMNLFDGKNVILNTPTGSGKSLVALAIQFLSLCQKKRSYYTAPVKALVNEKFLALCKVFGPDQVGLVTGDASVNSDAPIVCCTAEILANLALRKGENCDVANVIIDEFHYYSDRERGVAWQVPLIVLKRTRFLIMSATLGDVSFFEKGLTQLNGFSTVTVSSSHRPVPLNFYYETTPLQETILGCVTSGRSPVYLVSFSQRQAAEEAQNLMSIDICSKDEKKAIKEALAGVRFNSPYGKEIQKLLYHGVGIHHAGLLPRYRLTVEALAQRGLLKVISGTDTLGVGVNVPIRTVLFTQLCKFDGQKTTIVSVRDFKQIAGRAGRKGFDDQGYVIAQAPEHVIENLKLEAKAGGDPKKAKKIVKRKPPEKGFVMWTKETFEKLRDGTPEALVSRFQVNHGMVLNVLARESGCEAMRTLIRNCHETDLSKEKLRRHAFQIFRSLVERSIIQFVDQVGQLKKSLKLNVDLQQDFSLHQTLSLFLIDTLPVLDRDDPEYALNMLTLCEAIVENPDAILRKQLDKVKSEKMAQMKQDGVEFEGENCRTRKIRVSKTASRFYL